jgi:hypothetical protein
MMLCTSVGFLDLFDYVPGFPPESARTVWESAMESDGLPEMPPVSMALSS